MGGKGEERKLGTESRKIQPVTLDMQKKTSKDFQRGVVGGKTWGTEPAKGIKGIKNRPPSEESKEGKTV